MTNRLLPRFRALTTLSGLALLLAVSACDNNSSKLFSLNDADTRVMVDDSNGEICDLLDDQHCLLPFPNNFFTTADASSDTGLRLNFQQQAMLQSSDGVALDPTEYNRNDGFSPGNLIALHVEGVDLAQSGAAPLTDIAASLNSDAAIVLINASTGERHPYWAELDANAVDGDGAVIAAEQALIIRPARNFSDGQRYIVALRNLRDASGDTIAPKTVFAAYRDNQETTSALVEARRPAMESLFAELETAGVARDELYLAWDFTVASTTNLSERILHMRDTALASLNGDAPVFTIDTVTDLSTDPDQPDWGRRIEGTITVPNFMNSADGGPGSAFNFADDGDNLPDRINGDNTLTQPFICNIPQVSLDNAALTLPPQATRPYLYGHGLLGSRTQANNNGHQAPMANRYDMLNCAVDWLGMADSDVPNAIGILQGQQGFNTLADRLQQGFLGFMFLAEALEHPQGFSQQAAFQVNGQSVYDNSEVFYDGNSQGGILGGAFMAVSHNVNRGVLGVPGMNYSTLLRRSVDFDLYSSFLKPTYPNILDQTLVLSLYQLLWDRGETNGYANHLNSDPLPNTSAKEVLMHVAYGDHQVSHTTAEVMARTLGAAIHQPAVVAGRHHDPEPYFGLDALAYPSSDSAILIWDGGPGPNAALANGTPTPPISNTPPREGDDPHGRPRASLDVFLQKSEFMKSAGTIINVCGDNPCFTDGWDGTLP